MIRWAAKALALTLVFVASADGDRADDWVLAGLVGGVIAAVVRPGPRRVGWHFRGAGLPAALRLTALVTFELVRGTLQVAAVIVGLRPARPGIVEVPIGGWSREAVLLEGFLLSVSPGSFVLAVDWPRERLIVHLLDAADPEAAARRLVDRYDRHQRHFLP